MRAELVRLYREQPAYLVAAITHQVGQEITKRNVSIQPTLTIRARLPDAGNGEQGSDHAAVPAAVLPEGIVAMSMSTSKLRLGPLPKTETVEVTIALTTALKADLERYAALMLRPTASRLMPRR